MKSSVWGIILLIAMISVSAEYPSPDTLFQFNKAACLDTGSALINLTHEGMTIAFSDLNFTIEGEDLSPQPLNGEWFIANYPVSNYEFPDDKFTGPDFVSSARFTYITTSPKLAEGKYIVTLSWPSNTIYYDNIKFAINCPGFKCKTNDDCLSQQVCENLKCKWLKCSESAYATGHNCLPKCDDNNKCTNDYQIEGKCVYIKIDGCCNKNEDCEKPKECIGNKCNEKSMNMFARFWNWLKSKYK